MIEPTVGTLAQRLNIMERQNRRLKRMGMVILAGATVLTLMGQARLSRTVEAEKFILKDASGKVRAEIGMGEKGPALRFRAEDGKFRIGLGLVGDEHGLFLLDANERKQATLGVGSLGPALMLYDNKGKRRMVFGMSKGAQPLFELAGTNEVWRVRLLVTDTGSALDFQDSRGQRQLMLVGDPKGGGLGIYDANDILRGSLGLSPFGAQLSLLDENGELRAALGAMSGGPGLVLYDAKGKPVFSTP